MFSLFVAARSPAASIYAFEPIYLGVSKARAQPPARILLANAHVFCCALSSVPGQTPFTYYPGYSTMSSQTSYADTAGDKAIVKSQVLKELQRTSGMREASASSRVWISCWSINFGGDALSMPGALHIGNRWKSI